MTQNRDNDYGSNYMLGDVHLGDVHLGEHITLKLSCYEHCNYGDSKAKANSLGRT